MEAINVKLAWTTRSLLLAAAMETILTNLEKKTAIVKITVTGVEDREAVKKHDI